MFRGIFWMTPIWMLISILWHPPPALRKHVARPIRATRHAGFWWAGRYAFHRCALGAVW